MSRRRKRRPQPTTDRRSPEERLEAMMRETNPERMHRMWLRILDDLDVRLDVGPWIAGARTLSERLIISENAFQYMAAIFTEALIYAASEADPDLCRLRDAIEAIERAHGLREDRHWNLAEAPEEWRALDAQWGRRADEIVSSALRELGHGDIADLRDHHPDEYERRTTQGRIEVWGEDEDTEEEPTQ